MSGGDDIDWEAEAAMDPIVGMMLQGGMPMTRDNYIDMAYGADVPEPWNEEAEQSLPQPFQMINQAEPQQQTQPPPVGFRQAAF